MNWLLLVLLVVVLPSFGQKSHGSLDPTKDITIPTVDISGDKFRQVVIAPGTKQERQGHPHTILLPDGKQLLMIMRENNKSFNSWIMLSDNEGRTWQEPIQAHASVTMDRHQARYANDGRLVIVGRDVAENSPSKGHFAAWIGTFDDLANGREGQYRIKLLHTYKTTEYPGLNKLPDGTFVATNSVAYREEENYSIVSTRFRLDDMDRKLLKLNYKIQ